MHRSDNSLYLLYIEPKKEERLEKPIDDILTNIMDIALELSIEGYGNYSNLNCNGRFFFGGGYMGWHDTDCGEGSSNHDYLLKSGHITNSLATFYLRWYRNSIPATEWAKLADVIYYHYRNFENPIPYDSAVIEETIRRLRTNQSDIFVQDF